MIVYGWNSKNIKQAPLEGYACPNCEEKDSHLAIFANYVHVFWIPLFPYKKSAQISCAHCQLATEEKSMPEDMKEKIKQLKSAVSIPKYLFAGLILIGLSIAYFSYTSSQNTIKEQDYIANPEVGDVYILEDLEEPSEYKYYLMKVSDLEGDSLLVSYNTYSYNTAIIKELDPADGFSDLYYLMHKNGVSEYDLSGELKKVIREYSDLSGFYRVIEYQELDTLVN